jgi:uncharacterized protein DUF4190
MICPRCQSSNLQEAAFCFNCGGGLRQIDSAPFQNVSGSEAPYSASNQAPTLKKGLAIASLVLGLVGLLTLGVMGVGSVIGLILGVVAVVKANADEEAYGGKGMATAGIMLNFVCLLIASTIAIAIVNRIPSRTQSIFANEVQALQYLESVSSCEAEIHRRTSRYGDLHDLDSQGLLDQRSFNSIVNASGYAIRIRLVDDTYEAIAVPLRYRATGRRSFYVSRDSRIHGADKNGREADASDPIVY